MAKRPWRYRALRWLGLNNDSVPYFAVAAFILVGCGAQLGEVLAHGRGTQTRKWVGEIVTIAGPTSGIAVLLCGIVLRVVKPRSVRRARRVAQWIIIATVGLWCLSLVWWISYSRQTWGFGVSSGYVVAHYTGAAPYRVKTGWEIRPAFNPAPYFPREDLVASIMRRLGLFPLTYGSGVILCPIWFPLLIAGCVFFMLSIYHPRKPPVGFCSQCGYDLTGNTSGRCPECGTGTTANASTAPSGAD